MRGNPNAPATAHLIQCPPPPWRELSSLYLCGLLLSSFFFSSFFLSSLKNLFSLLFFHLIYLFISIFSLPGWTRLIVCAVWKYYLQPKISKDSRKRKKRHKVTSFSVADSWLGTLNFSLRCPIDGRFLTGAGSCMGGLKKLRALAC